MAEWSKAHAWKVCNRQKRFMGSNPILSAKTKPAGLCRGILFLQGSPTRDHEVIPGKGDHEVIPMGDHEVIPSFNHVPYEVTQGLILTKFRIGN
jgi:hypothetical protein